MSSISSSCIDGYGNLTMHQRQVSSTSNFYNQNINSNQRGFQNGSLAYANEWAGIPLIKSNSSSSSSEQQQRYHKKIFSARSNGFEFDENSMSRLAKHTQGAPIIMSNSNRYRSNKPVKTMQSSFNHENCGSRNFTNNNSNSSYVTSTLTKSPITSSSSTIPPVTTTTTNVTTESLEENQNYEDAGYNHKAAKATKERSKARR